MSRDPFRNMDLDTVMSRGGPVVVPDISRPAPTDEQVESLLEQALASEDAEMVDLCETVLAMIVQPNLKRQAQARIAEILAYREVAL